MANVLTHYEHDQVTTTTLKRNKTLYSYVYFLKMKFSFLVTTFPLISPLFEQDTNVYELLESNPFLRRLISFFN